MIDLHIHTQASDGTWTPEEAVAAAARLGLSAVAFADHDSLVSVTAGRAAAGRHGLLFVTAVEVTAGSSMEEFLHILGYDVDPDHPVLKGVLASNQAAWDENECRSLENLARLGITVSAERYDYWKCHRERGGWPTYNCLTELGLVEDYREYFTKYFGPRRPAHVETSFVQPAEATAAIKSAGGVPILAHPGAYDEADRTVLERPGFLSALVEMGIEGFECFAHANGPAVTQYLLAYCAQRGLLVTGGSDCHGDFTPDRTLGRPEVPDEVLGPLLERCDRV